ncbi:MAG: hypothetical protein KatS3mg054_0502 [Chloroflexus sp.]|uniref:hypothetical protein n=1 Tax=Chloroflexus sp. TaxID=1904827 RepID=UPI0021DEF471|nr:hypothetical protein [Chloroflexus sp.]GIV86473.1 MAG: hypothetical protein KatS3mg054_0502 [Chloroflexus sp.]GIV92186.1 MAG: hypothetical protein KatS3mg056_0895 [Chloroflexus sp.]
MVDNMPLKTFLESVERQLADCPAEELRDVLRKMARQVPPAERRAFLKQLHDSRAATVVPQTAWEGLSDAIDELEARLKKAMKSADEWMDRFGWQYEDDEDAVGPYREFIEPLTLLFERTALAFDHGEFALAREAYRRLFRLLDQEDDYGYHVSLGDLTDLDQKDAVARYLRAIYQTEPLDRRPRVLYEEMRRLAFAYRQLYGDAPRLKDFIQLASDPLPEQDAFLRQWSAFLRRQNNLLADTWLCEVVRLVEGTAGLERLVRSKGQQRPHIYLDWFTALEEEGQYAQVLAEARLALQSLPDELPIRAAIADYLCAAASVLGDRESLLEGRWQAFVAMPELPRLLDLWEAVPAMEQRPLWMQRAVQHMKQPRRRKATLPPGGPPIQTLDYWEQPSFSSDALLAHARLLAGDLAAAHKAIARKPVLEESDTDNAQTLVLAWLLVLLSGQERKDLPPNLEHFWQRTLQEIIVDDWMYDQHIQHELTQRTDHIYADYLAWGRASGFLHLEAADEEKYLAWCLDTARKRVEAIVSNQYRDIYDEAANLTVACAELLRLRGDDRAADELVAHIRERFHRYRAFQRELRSALSRR